MYWFPRVAVLKYHKLEGLKKPEVYCLLVLETRNPKSRCQQPCSLRGILPYLFSLLKFASNSWHFFACRHIILSPPPLSQGCLFTVYVHLLFLEGHQSHWIRGPPYSIMTSSSLYLQQHYCQIRLPSEVLGVRFPTYLFGRQNLTQNKVQLILIMCFI